MHDGLPARVRSLAASVAAERDLWVLNSLTMLSSIIGIEFRALEDDAGRAALERVRSRLVADSNLYRILSAAECGEVIRADLYLRSVADAVAVQRELTTSQAASLGLITNEALTNAYRHAFNGRRDGRIQVVLSEADGELLLTVTDDGIGMPEKTPSGLGTRLVEALAVDLSGKISVESGDWGTSVRVRFPRAC